jgi:hypothetical protein
MYAVIVRMRSPRTARDARTGTDALPETGARAEAARWREAVRRGAGPEDGLEHVYVLTDEAEVGIVLWIAASGRGCAERTARRLVDRLSSVEGLSAPEVGDLRVQAVGGVAWIPAPRP